MRKNLGELDLRNLLCDPAQREQNKNPQAELQSADGQGHLRRQQAPDRPGPDHHRADQNQEREGAAPTSHRTPGRSSA